MSANNIIFAGVDDGHRETKIILSTGKRIIIPSRVHSGFSNRISINGAKSAVSAYTTQEGPFTAGDIGSSELTAYDDYPFSAQNRVIVTHALRQLGINGDHQINLVSGLPLKRYYLKGEPNKTLIRLKRENLLKSDVIGSDGYKPGKIIRHDVMAEAISSWVDYVLQRDEQGILRVDRERLAQRIAIVDIGGRTLDIAVVKNWDMDGDRSTTDEIGMITIIEAVRERLRDMFNGVDMTDEQVNQAVSEGTVKLWGKAHDVSQCVESANLSVVNSIRATLKGCLKNSQDIDCVFFVGGTSKYLQRYLVDWFPNQSIPEDSVFTNAMGMLKYAELRMGAAL